MSGFIVYHAKRDAFLNWKVYFSRESAEAALERVVWHNRDGWEILPMPQLRRSAGVNAAQEVQSSPRVPQPAQGQRLQARPTWAHSERMVGAPVPTERMDGVRGTAYFLRRIRWLIGS